MTHIFAYHLSIVCVEVLYGMLSGTKCSYDIKIFTNNCTRQYLTEE